MSLDKSINSGKDHRRKYYGSKSFDKTCRNHGSCPCCESNRIYKNKKAISKVEDQIKEHLNAKK
jgi:hypothetical protein